VTPSGCPRSGFGLARWNVGLAVLHLVQAVAVHALASSFAITLTVAYPTGPPGSELSAPEPPVDIRVGIAVAAFLALAALGHLLTGTVVRGRYERGLHQGINRFRWVEYSARATIMVLLIAMYTGITAITAVIAVAGANVGADTVPASSPASSSRSSCSSSALRSTSGCSTARSAGGPSTRSGRRSTCCSA